MIAEKVINIINRYVRTFNYITNKGTLWVDSEMITKRTKDSTDMIINRIKAEMVGEKIGAFFHDHNAAGVKLQALFKILGIIVEGRFCRNEKERFIRNRALGFGAYNLCGRWHGEFFPSNRDG